MSRVGGPVDLQALYRRDPRAALVGEALNTPRLGGVDHDGDPSRLTWSEFRAAAPGFLRLYPGHAPEVARLQTLFEAAPSRPPAPTDPGPGLVDPADAWAPADSAGVETGGAHLGPDRLIFERGDAELTRSVLRAASLDGGASEPLLPNGPRLQLSASVVDGTVFFSGADDLQSAAQLYRWRPGDAAPQPVPGLDDLGPLSWPKVRTLADGSLMVAYRDTRSRPRLAWSEDGHRFHPLPGTVEPAGAAMVDLGVQRNGTLVMTYQLGHGARMQSVLRTSRDGHRWSPRRPVTEASDNVHDTTLVTRADGGLDLYYVYSTPTEPFALYRRALDEDLALGPEQRVSRPGEAINKPHAERRPEGGVRVGFVEVTARAPEGWVTGQGVRSVTLDTDAPSPTHTPDRG